jgi:hypothetical protein
MAFGRPPVCILRIGDFYNTKVIFESLNIDFDPLVWDLNQEGIGVQPMIATVSMNFKFIGGSDLTGPIARLQNAITFNFFANASVYDDRTDRRTSGSTVTLNGTDNSYETLYNPFVYDTNPVVDAAKKSQATPTNATNAIISNTNTGKNTTIAQTVASAVGVNTTPSDSRSDTSLPSIFTTMTKTYTVFLNTSIPGFGYGCTCFNTETGIPGISNTTGQLTIIGALHACKLINNDSDESIN